MLVGTHYWGFPGRIEWPAVLQAVAVLVGLGSSSPWAARWPHRTTQAARRLRRFVA